MQALPTVFIVDADEFAGEALKLLMRSAGWLVEVFESAGEFMSQPRAMNPGCLIVGIDGLELQQALVDRPEIPTIFVTSHCDISIAVRAMKAGAVDFLVEPCSDAVILRAVDRALDHSRCALARELALSNLRDRYGCLSPREREVMGGVVCGKPNKQVGADLGISVITVKAHRGRVMRKMAAHSFADLVDMARALQSQEFATDLNVRRTCPVNRSGSTQKGEVTCLATASLQSCSAMVSGPMVRASAK